LPDDPLSRLKDLHLPEASGWWPPAPGWWLVVGILLLSPLLWHAWQKWRNRKRVPVYRRAALQELEQSWRKYQADPDDAAFIQAVSALLKRVALQCYEPQQVASLSGEQWGEFLGRDQDAATRRQIVSALSRLHSREQQADTGEFYAFARSWIQAQEKF
jgi:hypothetical protein